ncbi:MAG TPA: C4-dicarboxylate ABC transporter [Spirochaeta sp.]|nr:C4-dicarboxylate ABC transporter [Spirochaeta sp.]
MSNKDKKITQRTLTGISLILFKVIAFGLSAYYLYTCAFGIINMQQHRGIYFLLTMLLCFLLFPFIKTESSKIPVYDWIIMIIALGAIGLWILDFGEYVQHRTGMPSKRDIALGIVLILLSLEMGRRVVGKTLPILAIVFIAYAYAGPYLPGILGHYGFSTKMIVENTAVTMGGIFGIVTNTYATYIFPFIVFAAFLQASGAGDAIENIAKAIAGTHRGGAAKIAVVSSGLIGSVTGSSAANAVMTGAYTIPMMKRLGYKSHDAAGIEAAASTGGQFMPPIMGAAAFLIASFTETPYIEIIKVAFIPAVLYFIGVGFMVHFLSGKDNLQGLPKDQVPRFARVILKEGYLLAPIVIIIVLLVIGFSVQYSAVIAIILSIVLSFFNKNYRINPKRFVETMIHAAKTSLMVGSTAGVIGIIMGIITLTGLGLRFSSFIIELSGGVLPITILFIAIAGYILGMGVTITSSYILLSILAAPALVQLGVPLLTAHLVVFWFCQTGGVTPPVALVAFAASSIAECSPAKAGTSAVKLASPLFLMPFLFVYTPLLLTGTIPAIVATIISSVIGMIGFAGMMQGFWIKHASVIVRILLGVSAGLLFMPFIAADIGGLVLLGATTLINIKLEYKPRKTISA